MQQSARQSGQQHAVRIAEPADRLRAARIAGLALTFAVALAACTSTPPASKPAPSPTPPPAAVAPAPPPAPAAAVVPPAPAAAPVPTQDELDEIARRELDEGIALYDKGDYNAAIDKLVDSASVGKASVGIRTEALKYAAFSYCVTRRPVLCRIQFEMALRLDPQFELKPAEKGHPLWSPAFERARRAELAAHK